MRDEDVVERLKQGDEQSFIEMVDSYKRKVLSLCYSYTEDYYEAEDLSQEVFIALHSSIKQFRGACSLSTYIYKITLSKCMDFKRKKSIKGFLTDIFTIQKTDKDLGIDLDEKNYVRECIKELPKDLKAVIVLYYYTGLSQKEIGDVLNISPRAVEGRIYRAKQKLKREFQKEEAYVCSKNGMI